MSILFCPICTRGFHRYEGMRDNSGKAWCEKCQDEFDSIDWDEINERRLDEGY